MNNPVNCEDPSGYFVVYIPGVGVQGYGVDSGYATATSYTQTIGGGSGNSSTKSHTMSGSSGRITSDEGVNIAGSTAKNSEIGAATYVLGDLGKGLIKDAGRYGDDGVLMKTAGTGMKVAGKSIVIIDAAVSFGGDIMESKSTKEVVEKCVIDGVSIGITATANVFLTPVGGAIVGVGISFGADLLKSWLW